MNPVSPEDAANSGALSASAQVPTPEAPAASREELQAANEVLQAANAQLQLKNEELNRAHSEWESLLSSADIVMVFLDREGRLKKYTPHAQSLFRLVPSDVGRAFVDLQHGFGNENVMADVQRVRQTREPMEREMHTEDGRWFLSRLSPYQEEGDNSDCVVITFVDISQTKRAEQAQRHSEERMRLIVESAHDYAIFTLDPQRRVNSWNSGAQAVFGFPEEEILGQWGDILFVPEDRAQGAPEDEVKKAASEGRAEDERWHLRRDGSRFYGSGLVMPLRDEQGSMIGFVKIMRDLTQRKQAEEALKASEERFRALIGQGSDMITVSDTRGRIIYASPSTERVSGYTPEEFMARSPFATIHPDDRKRCEEALHQLTVTPGLTLSLQHRIQHKDGTTHWIEGTFTSLFHNPAVGGVVANVRDITERKLAEEALRESEERLRLALDAGRIGTCDWNYQTGEMLWNEARFLIYGREPQDRLMHITELFPLVHPDDREQLRNALKTGIEERGEHNEEYRIVWPDGRVRWIHESGRVVEWHDGQPLRVISVLFDVTAHHEAQEILRRSHEELELLVQERTSELAQALRQVRAEVEQRRRAEAGRTELVRRIVNTQEEERGRISRELHDNLGQHLTAIMLGLQALEMEIASITGGKRQQEAPQLTNLRSLVDGLMKAAHRQAWELRPAELDALGLEAALGQYTSDWSQRTGIEIDFQSMGWKRRPSREVETTFYRVVQEALTNVARHAAATVVSVVLERSDSMASVIIEDNGRGFDTEQHNSRLGILGMQERLALVGGTLEIESIPEEGTTVFARVPLSSQDGN